MLLPINAPIRLQCLAFAWARIQDHGVDAEAGSAQLEAHRDARRLMELGHAIISGGTDNHLVLLNLNPAGVDGSRVQQLLDEVSRALRPIYEVCGVVTCCQHSMSE